MSPRKFDRFMVDVHIASNPKLSRLTTQERWCHVAGVLSLAALAPIRGRLLIGDEPADAGDIARRAGVSVGVARSTLAKLRKVGVIVPDEEHDCEQVHDFEDWNPAPRTDRTAAERQQRRRDRVRASRRDSNGVTASVTPRDVTKITQTEVEVEEKSPPNPPVGGRTRDRLNYELEFSVWAAEAFPGVHASLVEHFCARLRSRRVQPTVGNVRALIEEHEAKNKKAREMVDDERRAA